MRSKPVMNKLHPGQPRCQLLDRNCIEFSTSDERKVFELIETKKGGEIVVHCSVNGEALCLKKFDKKVYEYFTSKKCADFAILVNDAQGYHIHIFECTKTIKATKWYTKVLPQFEGGLNNALLLASFLGIEDPAYTTHLIFQNDEITKSEESNPALGHRGILDLPIKNCWNSSTLFFEHYGNVTAQKVEHRFSEILEYRI